MFFLMKKYTKRSDPKPKTIFCRLSLAGLELITERFAYGAIMLGFRMTLEMDQFRYWVFRVINHSVKLNLLKSVESES